jgi:hypothetical protein
MTNIPLVRKRIASTLVAAAALAWGCDANHVLGVADGGPMTGTAGVGGHTAPANGGSSGGQAGQAGQTTMPVDAATGPEVGPLGPSQTWTGYVENFMFPSGSDTLAVSVAADAQGNTVGTITLGHGTPPAPATDPNIGYPPSLEMSSLGLGLATAINFYAEGYPYTFDQGTQTSQRLKFTAKLNQMWAGWCSLETEAGDSGTCLPNTGGMSSGDGKSCAYGDPNHPGKYIPVDCGRFALCGFASVCTCTASGCSLNPSMGSIVSLDIAINGGAANGSLEGPFGNQSVQLTKSP